MCILLLNLRGSETNSDAGWLEKTYFHLQVLYFCGWSVNIDASEAVFFCFEFQFEFDLLGTGHLFFLQL